MGYLEASSYMWDIETGLYNMKDYTKKTFEENNSPKA